MNDKPKNNSKIHHRRSIRLKGYDYSQAGLYFITICCQDRACLFGEIGVGANCIRPSSSMILNEYGTIAHNEWIKTTELRPNVELGEFIVMPNHIHGIIKLNGGGEFNSPHNVRLPHNVHPFNNDFTDNEMGELHSSNNVRLPHNVYSFNNDFTDNEMGEFNSSNNVHLPHNVYSFNNDFTDKEMGEFNSPLRGPTNNIGSIIRGYKSSVTKKLNLINIDCVVWQRNYYEHIIRNEQSYQTISNYIINNPAKWAEDKFYNG